MWRMSSIGAARAAFFPSITLTGNCGTASTQLSGLFDHGSTAWTFSPQISLPIFAGGANVASLNLATVQKNINIVQYEQAIQTAFREVADALAGRGTLDTQIAADQALVEATSESYRLSDMGFRGGVNDYLSVLDSQRSLYSAQQTLIGIKLARLQNVDGSARDALAVRHRRTQRPHRGDQRNLLRPSDPRARESVAQARGPDRRASSSSAGCAVANLTIDRVEP
jgi:Outer membrane efflux protein